MPTESRTRSPHKVRVMQCVDVFLDVIPDKETRGFEIRPTEFRFKHKIVALFGGKYKVTNQLF